MTPDAHHNLLQTVFDYLPSGIIVIDNYHLMLANSAALRLLNLDASQIGTILRIDGPDGPLGDRIVETATAAAGAVAKTTEFDYQLAITAESWRKLHIKVVPLESGQFMAYCEELSASQIKVRENGIKVNHAIKTPLAILSAGLSTLINYYDRYSDPERRELLDEMLQQVRLMATLLTDNLPGNAPSDKTGIG